VNSRREIVLGSSDMTTSSAKLLERHYRPAVPPRNSDWRTIMPERAFA
jgi:hypothetical protein